MMTSSCESRRKSRFFRDLENDVTWGHSDQPGVSGTQENVYFDPWVAELRPLFSLARALSKISARDACGSRRGVQEAPKLSRRRPQGVATRGAGSQGMALHVERV